MKKICWDSPDGFFGTDIVSDEEANSVKKDLEQQGCRVSVIDEIETVGTDVVPKEFLLK